MSKAEDQSIDQLLHRRLSLRSYPLVEGELNRRTTSDSSEEDIRSLPSQGKHNSNDVTHAPPSHEGISDVRDVHPEARKSETGKLNTGSAGSSKKEELASSSIPVSNPKFYQHLFQNQSKLKKKDQKEAALAQIPSRVKTEDETPPLSKLSGKHSFSA